MNSSPKWFVLAFLVVLAPIAQGATPALRIPFQHVPDPGLIVPDEFVVVMSAAGRRDLRAEAGTQGRPRVNDPSLQILLDNLGVLEFRRQFTTAVPRGPESRFPDLTGHYKVRLSPDGADLQEAMATIASHPRVDHVEPIGIHPVDAVPNDPYYRDSPNPSFNYDQWHYWKSTGLELEAAWDLETGDPGVVVGILDSGVRYFHVDLGGNNALWTPAAPATNGNIWINPAETPGNATDDDGNGFVDDVIGWDFVSSGGGAGVTCLDQDCSGVDNDPDDGDGHGTHVAGTVAAITNNAILGGGVAGGFSNGLTSGSGNGVKVMCLRIGYLARYQGQTTGVVRMDWAAEAMNYVADQVDAGVNVAAINCSWGSSDTGGLGAAVTNLLAHDVLIVHSAGNSNSSNPDFLGNRAGVMNVAATDSAGAGASFTNYGSWVDLAAPGVIVLSTYANPDDPDLTNHYIALLSGTSMSSPHVTGVAALLESYRPQLTATEKFDIMVATTTSYNDPRDLGSGILNANNALQMVMSQIGVAEDLFRRPPQIPVRAFPNPTRAGTSLLVESAGGPAVVTVTDLQGRRVRSLPAAELSAGINAVRWDGLDDQGHPVAGGIYFVSIRTGQATGIGKVLVVR